MTGARRIERKVPVLAHVVRLVKALGAQPVPGRRETWVRKELTVHFPVGVPSPRAPTTRQHCPHHGLVRAVCPCEAPRKSGTCSVGPVAAEELQQRTGRTCMLARHGPQHIPLPGFVGVWLDLDRQRRIPAHELFFEAFADAMSAAVWSMANGLFRPRP